MKDLLVSSQNLLSDLDSTALLITASPSPSFLFSCICFLEFLTEVVHLPSAAENPWEVVGARSVVLAQLQGRLRADEKIIGRKDNTWHLYSALELSTHFYVLCSVLVRKVGLTLQRWYPGAERWGLAEIG